MKRRRGSRVPKSPVAAADLEIAAGTTDAGARRRLADFLDRLSRVDREDFQRISLPPPAASRREAHDRAIDAATAAGRGELLEAARKHIRDGMLEEYSGAGYRPTWFGYLNWSVSTGRPQDRVALAVALEDAAIAAIVEDILSADDLAELTWPYDILARQATGGPPPESLGYALGSHWGRLTAVAFLFVVVMSFAIPMSAAIGPVAFLAATAVFVGVVWAFRMRAARRRHKQEPSRRS